MDEKTPYVAARFDGDDALTEFVIGDGREFGNYMNRELTPGVEYKAFIKTVINVCTRYTDTRCMYQI